MHALRSGIRIRDDLQVLEIKAWHEVRPGDPTVRSCDVDSVLGHLRPFFRDPFSMSTLRRASSTILWDQDHNSSLRTDDDVLLQLASRVVAGRLCLVRLDLPRNDGEGGGTSVSDARDQIEEPEPPAETQQADAVEPPIPTPDEQAAAHWIAFQLLDVDTDEPLAGVNLRLRLPDGSVGLLTTDAQGLVHLDGITAGTCDLEEVLDDDGFEIVHVA